jgi:predicted nucleic acid-binding protein
MPSSVSDVVIDASAIIAVIADEPERKIIVEATVGSNLLAPAAVHWEIGNAFSAMLRRGRITLEQARRAIRIYYQIPIRLVDLELLDALDIAAQHSIFAYDAYLIACAERYRLPLMTLDRGLVTVARSRGTTLIEVTS